MDIAKFSPDGKYIAAASALENALYLFEATQLRLVCSRTFHIRPINAIAWSPCSNYIATGGEDCAVVVWGLETAVDHVDMVPKRVLRGHIAPVISLNFHPRGTLLASGGIDECIYMWDVVNKVPYKRLFVHNEPIFAVEFSFDGDLLMTASFEGYVRIWNVKEGMVLRTLHHGPRMGKISAARFSPNSAFVLIFYWGGFIQLVDIVGGDVVRKFRCPRREGKMEPRNIVFMKPNHFLVATQDGVIRYCLDQSGGEDVVSTKPALCVDYNLHSGAALRAGPDLELVQL